MAVFSSRSLGYKGGVVLLFFSTVVFIVGFAVPFWVFYSDSNASAAWVTFRGLWMACASLTFDGSSNTECGTYAWKQIGAAFHAVRALETLCLIGLVASCTYALVTNCRTVALHHNRVLEILAGLSGLVGFVGCMVFVGSIKEDDMPLFYSFRDKIHFAFYLATLGSGFCVVTAIIIALTNTPVETTTQGGGYVVQMASFPQGQVQGQVQGQGQPAAGGGYYGQTPAQSYSNAQSYGNYPQSHGNIPQSYGYPQLQGYPQSYGNPPQSYGYPVAI